MATVDNVRLPDDIESGAEIGPAFQTSIIELTSGVEQRNEDWSQERLKANISYGMMRRYNNDGNYSDGEVSRTFDQIIDFYRARRGRGRGFLFRDWSDYQANKVNIGTGDGVRKVFQLKLTYGSYERRITRPDPPTVKIYANDVAAAFTLGSLGKVTMTTPPAIGEIITATFDWDIPVRFDTDVMQVAMRWVQAGEINNIELIGLRE